MTAMPIELTVPAALLVKLRDKFAPGWRLRLRTGDGVLPFDNADLVATQLARGKFERAELSLLVNLLPHCRGLVDVGANLGLYTLLAARRMPEGRVFAFEASAIEFDKLSWTIRENKLDNVTAVHCAVSDGDGEATIHESLYGAGALNRLDAPGKPTGAWRATKVRKTSLDSYFANSSAIVDLMKIDVEGHEFPVLRGAQGFFAKHAPLVMIEVNPSRASAHSGPQQIFDYMHAQGYSWFAIDEARALLRKVEAPVNSINYFAAPSARSDALMDSFRRKVVA